MALHEVKGDLLDTHCNYICHQVNCQGKMNSGVAKQIREKWPQVYRNYMRKFDPVKNGLGDEVYLPANIHLGTVQMVPLYDDFETDLRHKQVVNMFAQENYGYDGRRYTSYDAFWACLGQLLLIPKGETIAFPYKIGSDRGGANWNIIRTMIEEVLGEDYEVFIYRLED